MTIEVQPSGGSCGAMVRGVDLHAGLTETVVGAIEHAWLQHLVLGFPDQHLTMEDLERFCLALGEYGDDPYIAPIDGHPHIIEVRREPDEIAPLFAEGWHSDWSFLATPPAGTALFGTVIPPTGGDTLYADQCAAYESLSPSMKGRLDGMHAVHSARRGYSRAGSYGEKDAGRSMAIRWSDTALATQRHPMVKIHPLSGRKALFVNPGYTVGIDGVDDAEAQALLAELFAHQVQQEFIYRHRWSPNMLTLWDNRCLLHSATGGYEGHRRLLHRITIAERTRV